MTDKKIKAVLFDFGETLLNFGRVDAIKLFRQGSRLSYDFLKSCGQPVGNFKFYYWRSLIFLRLWYLLSRITGNDFDSLVLLKKIAAKKGVRLNEQQWQHLAWLWYEPLSKLGRAEPNLAETLAKLKELGIKLGMVSNTFINSSSLEKHLEQEGILDFFVVRLYSYEFKFRKPDVRIFKAAAEKIGEKFRDIMFVGDRIDNDIKPALELGMQVVLKTAYTNVGRKVPTGVLKINRLCELPVLVEKINSET